MLPWKRAIDEFERAAREVHRMGHGHDGELACELASIGKAGLDAIAEAMPKLEKLSGAFKRDKPCQAGPTVGELRDWGLDPETAD